MFYILGPVLCAKDKAINKAARTLPHGTYHSTGRHVYNKLQKLSCGYYGAGWHSREAEGAGRVHWARRVVWFSWGSEKANLGNF